MLSSLILAWLTVLCSVPAALKWVARITGNRRLNRFFHNIHIPFGVLALTFGLLHGLLAGNPATAGRPSFRPEPLLLTLNYGSACFLCLVFLASTYLLRKKLKKYWMVVHRTLTVLLLLLLVLHLTEVGIQLPSRVFGKEERAASTQMPASTGEQQTRSTEETKETEEAEETVETGETVETTLPLVTFSGAVLADGTYTGTADGYKGEITLTVTVRSGAVCDVTVDRTRDTERFFQSAMGVIDRVIDGQSLEVDAVTGATYSSAGILQAIYNALEQAVIQGQLEITEVNLSTGHR
ncbi:MAG: FMN-binding protein [Faecousia sp.]